MGWRSGGHLSSQLEQEDRLHTSVGKGSGRADEGVLQRQGSKLRDLSP